MIRWFLRLAVALSLLVVVLTPFLCILLAIGLLGLRRGSHLSLTGPIVYDWWALPWVGVPLFVVLVLIVIAFLALKIVQGKPPLRVPQGDAEDSRIMQEIYHSLSHMEERIEALETLLIENRSQRGIR